MRRILFCLLFAIVSSTLLISAQDQNSGLAHFLELTRQGSLSQVIQAANSLLSSDKLPLVEQSGVRTYLGHAYQRAGETHAAIECYEKALAILDRDGHHPVEYAITLGAMGSLYAEIRQTDTAKHLLLQSIHLLVKEGDHHAEIAFLWNDLATIAAGKHSRREAHKFVTHAIAESQLISNLSPDVSSALLTTQARIAELNGDPRTAIADYQHALDLSKQSHDDREPDTAWLYVLLGGADLQAGDLASARDMTSRGLNLLESSCGRLCPRFLSAELVYSKILDASGSHNEASQFRNEAQAGLNADNKRVQGEISIFALH